MSDDQPRLLGNLPRSRPGTRSEKREPAKARTARRPAASSASAATRPDPVGGTLKGAARVAGAGLRAANGVTRHVLRRIPRP